MELTDGMAFDINSRKTVTTYAAENLFLKCSWMIHDSLYSRKSIITQLIYANISSIYGGTRSCDDSTIALTSNSIICPPVWKFGDVVGSDAAHPYSGAATHEGGNNDDDGGGNNNDDDNNDDDAALGGGNNNNDDDDDDDDDGGGNDGGGWIDGITALEPITIHRINFHMDTLTAVPRSPIETSMYAFRYDNWEVLCQALYRVWRCRRDENRINAAGGGGNAVRRNPTNCWPGSFVRFGRYEGESFYEIRWTQYSLNSVQALIRDVIVLRPIYDHN